MYSMTHISIYTDYQLLLLFKKKVFPCVNKSYMYIPQGKKFRLVLLRGKKIVLLN